MFNGQEDRARLTVRNNVSGRINVPQRKLRDTAFRDALLPEILNRVASKDLDKKDNGAPKSNKYEYDLGDLVCLRGVWEDTKI